MSTHPCDELKAKAEAWSLRLSDPAFAAKMDEEDPIHKLRSEFHVPKRGDLPHAVSEAESSEECVYLCGNSLGLQPKGTQPIIQEELEKWSKRGVLGHMDDSARPWVNIDEYVVEESARIVGANVDEVAIMNTLTVNLHLLMVAFYQPTQTRFKILLEGKAFPSDFYAISSQIRMRGFNPEEAMIEMAPREGEHCLREEDICKMIEDEGDSIALVLFSGVQFYTGQLFDMERITKAGHAKGCMVGFDLAHAVGNAVLKLHDWEVDFACWCTYKYLNSGPGGIAGAFVHEKHAKDVAKRGLLGWWGVDLKTRFQMNNGDEIMPGVRGLQLSNPGVLVTVALLGSLQVFKKTSMEEMRAKSLLLTGYLEALLKHMEIESEKKIISVISPTEPERRGCQLSLLFSELVTPIFDLIEQRGVVCDMRKPNVLRIAPAPLYNSFSDVHRFVSILKKAMDDVHAQAK